MANKGVQLLGFWPSPFAQRVKWALELKGIEYEYTEEDIFNKSPRLLELNPIYGKVPVLVHKGRPICESFLILEYIDETWKLNPLSPQDPYRRAMARFWAKFVDDRLLEFSWAAMNSSGDEQQKAVTLAVEAIGKIEGELRGTKFFGGDTIGNLDFIVGWVSYMLPVFEEVASMKILHPQQHPAMAEWCQSFLSHPLIQGSLPSKDELFGYFEKRRTLIMAHYASINQSITDLLRV